MFKGFKGTFFLFLVILAFSYLVLSPSFSLALFGDDWLAFFRFRQHVDPGSGQWNYLTYYLTPYGSQDILMGVLNKIYGLNSTLYYLTSFSFRMLAAFSFYPLVYFLTKNKLSAFFAVLFFSLTVVGLDTTNWVFNMPTYATISLFNISLYFFLLNREKPILKTLLFSGIFYYFAYITTPIRMHGSLPLLLLLEAFWVLQVRDVKTIKKAAVRFGVMLLVFLIVRYTGHSMGPSNEVSERLSQGLQVDVTLLKQGRFDFLFYPILMFGSMIIPDIISPQFMVTATRSLLPLVMISFSVFSLILVLMKKYIEALSNKFFKIIILTSFLWTLFCLLIYKGNVSTLSVSGLFLLLLIGGYVMILGTFLLIVFFKQKWLSTSIFLGLAWSILSFFFAWWWLPTSIFPTTYRYLIVSAAGVTIFLSSLISLSKNRSRQFALFFLLLPLILINIWIVRLFLNQSLSSHSQMVSNKVWNSLPVIPEISKNREPFIFYFEGDGTNGAILHDVITFGFPPHMALTYGLRDGDPIPVPMSDFREVASAVIDGKPMPAYGYKVKPVDINRIYAFLLRDDNLIDVTKEARNKLEQFKKDYQQNSK